MSNKTIEATLKIGAKEGNTAALLSVAQRLAKIEAATKAVNRANMASLKTTQTQMIAIQRQVNSHVNAVSKAGIATRGMLESSVLANARWAGPAGIAYGVTQSFRQFAVAERHLSRIGIKLGATREEMEQVRATIGQIAGKYALPADDLVATVDAIAESGGSLADVRAELEGLGKVQQGLGAGGAEVVATWDAAKRSLGLASTEAEKFFDRIAAGGAAGKFEGSDLARYLPSLLPIAASRGFKGMDGIERMVGALETMRDFTGTSQEAAASVADFMEKVASPDVERNFKKFNIDLPKALKASKRDGIDLFTAMTHLIRKATGGDMDKLGHLFGDKEARRFAMLLLQQGEALEDKIDTIRNKSDGMISNNVNTVLADAQASVDRLSNSWDEFLKSVGSASAPVIVPVLDAVVEQIDDGQAMLAGRKKLAETGRSVRDYQSEYIENYKKDNPDVFFGSAAGGKKFKEALRALGRGEIKNIFDPLPGEIPDWANSPGGPQSRPARREKGIPTPTPRPTEASLLGEHYRDARYLPAAGASSEAERIAAVQRRIDVLSEPNPIVAFEERLIAALQPEPRDVPSRFDLAGGAPADWFGWFGKAFDSIEAKYQAIMQTLPYDLSRPIGNLRKPDQAEDKPSRFDPGMNALSPAHGESGFADMLAGMERVASEITDAGDASGQRFGQAAASGIENGVARFEAGISRLETILSRGITINVKGGNLANVNRGVTMPDAGGFGGRR